jgi:oxygen-independent coproporphyrinogen-3 oxidase
LSDFPIFDVIALYLHLPWCVRKCPYCDFNSHALQGALPENDYLAALLADLDTALPQIRERNVSSIFMGGGTPSLFSAQGIQRLLADIRARVTLSDEVEITLEANPGTLERAGAFADFRAAGVNRLSLGVQSFNDTHLAALGRIHDRDAALRAAAGAVRHFERVNLDVMYGLPSQTLTEALADIETALDFSPTHLSCYQLTLEANTRFAAQPPPLPNADICADMGEAIAARLAAAGFVHYEISAFARPGHLCRHNLNYWRFGDYLGLGAGAHSKLSHRSENSSMRMFRERRWQHPDVYMRAVAAGKAVQERQAVAAEEMDFEFLMNALRLSEGFDAALYERRTGLPFAALLARLQPAVQAGLLEVRADCVAPTRQGRNFLNRLLTDFLD